ncbi:hypothetical protein Tco_1140287 [Tanacetum coccineum]
MQVVDQNIQEEVKESGLESLGDVTFEQIMDEYDQTNKAAQEVPESPYDTESEIKIIKRFQICQADADAQITFLGSEPYDMEIDQTSKKDDSDETDFGLQSMPDDDLASLSGFQAEDSDDEAQSDPLGHLHEELRTLNTKVDQLKSSISKKVTDDIQSFVPSIIDDALKANLPEKLTLSDEQVKQTLQDQLPSIGGQPPTQELSNVEQASPVNEENALVLHASMENSSEVNTLEKKVTDDEPPPDATTMTIEQFTEHIFKNISSIFSPTPPRELTPPRYPPPPKDESKGKGIATEAKALGIPPPHELSTFEVSINEKKRKKSSKILNEVFIKEDVVVDGIHRNLVPPSRVEGRKGLVIREPEYGIFFYNGNFDLVFQREEEFHLATTAQLIRHQNAIKRGSLDA